MTTSQNKKQRGIFSLRMKIFGMLLFFSVVPILMTNFVIRSCTRDVQERLYIETRADLTDQAMRDLQYIAQNFAFIMELDAKATEAILSTMDIATQSVLKADMEQVSPPIFTRDLSKGTATLPNPQILDSYQPVRPGLEMKKGMQNSMPKHIPVPVSFDAISYHMAPNAKEDLVRYQALQIQLLTDMFQQSWETYHDWMFRFYIGFASGLHATYPAHGQLSQYYDPRNRIWYQDAIDQKGKIVWTSPLKDASTGHLTMTASKAVYSPSGELIGVVGLDILLEQELSQHMIASNWQDETTMMLAVITDEGNPDAGRLQVVAESQAGSKGMWRMGHGQRFIMFDDTEYEDMMREALLESDSGTLAMPWRGIPSFWAWSKFSDDGWFFAVTPINTVMSMPNKIIDYLAQASLATQRIAGASVILVAILALGVAILATRRVTKPMHALINAVRRLSDGDFSVRLNLQTGDERDTVINAVNAMGPRLATHMETQQTLAVAKEVQENLLPKGSPLVNGWDIAGVSRYCDETGGDYYDFFPVQTGKRTNHAVLVGDVSGHGVPSALLMTTARALLRGQADCSRLTTAERITRVNHLLTHDLYGSGRFMTLFAMEVEEGGNEICWVRAGHDPAQLYSPQGDTFSELTGGGLPLGVLEDTVYTGEHREITESGSIILIGTDGIWEAPRASDGEMFGKERMKEIVRANAHTSAEAICTAILEAHAEWCRNARRLDDVTLVVVRKK